MIDIKKCLLTKNKDNSGKILLCGFTLFFNKELTVFKCVKLIQEKLYEYAGMSGSFRIMAKGRGNVTSEYVTGLNNMEPCKEFLPIHNSRTGLTNVSFLICFDEELHGCNIEDEFEAIDEDFKLFKNSLDYLIEIHQLDLTKLM